MYMYMYTCRCLCLYMYIHVHTCTITHMYMYIHRKGENIIWQETQYKHRHTFPSDTCTSLTSQLSYGHEWILLCKHSLLAPSCSLYNYKLTLLQTAFKWSMNTDSTVHHLSEHLSPTPSKNTHNYMYDTEVHVHCQLTKIAYYSVKINNSQPTEPPWTSPWNLPQKRHFLACSIEICAVTLA